MESRNNLGKSLNFHVEFSTISELASVNHLLTGRPSFLITIVGNSVVLTTEEAFEANKSYNYRLQLK